MPQQQFTKALPDNWDGRFPFTNPSDEDFSFIWGKKAYLFPAHRTVDMMRMNFNATPLEVMSIRKKAAKKLAEREFFKSKKYQAELNREGTKDEFGVIQPRLMSFHAAGQYTLDELADYIQKCLAPEPETIALVADAPTRDILQELHRDPDTGEMINRVVKNDKGSLENAHTFADPTVILN